MDDFIKSGKKGTVLMSLGTNMKSNMLGEERLKVIIETFAQLPDYNFLWKFESELKDLPAVPTKNVMIGKFLPQNDILAHPNLIAFVTHSGMLSTHEAFWHGKPVVAMPFFVDQHMNSAKAVNLGVGVKVDFRTLTVQNFKSSIESVVKDPKYFKNSQRVSKLFRDKPQRPLDLAIWWIEYIIRNPKIENLMSPTIQLGPFISNSYDILLFALTILSFVFYLIVKVIRTVKKLFQNSDRKRKND